MADIHDFDKEELERYSRHLILPEFGLDAQLKLKKAKVLVVGAGGLGSPLLQYLTAAGIGLIGIVDYDNVDLSNLQRQVLYSEDDIGQSKAKSAIKKLKKLNKHVEFNLHDERMTSENALEIINQYDVVADGTDNFPTRYLVNDACVILDKPCVYASIFRYEGQVSVFNLKNGEGDNGPNYRDLFPLPPSPESVPNCADGGVLGVLAGIIGSIQANEVIKVVAQVGTTLSGKLFIVDSLNMDTSVIQLAKVSKENTITELIDYEEFCNMNQESSPYNVQEITVQELNEMQKSGQDFQLIDVRTAFEHHLSNLGGILVPLEELVEHIDEIDREKPVVLYCKVGIRSMEAILHLQSIYDFKNLINLKGGINAWATDIDNNYV